MPEQISMRERAQDFWWSTIEHRKKLMAHHHERWRELYRRYRLKGINIAGLDDDEIVKISRLYPMVRKIVNGISFNYPEIFMELEEEHNLGPGLEDSLEIAGNDGMKRMKMKRHVRQGILDVIFCYRAWWKIELADDSVSGVLSPRDIEHFTKFQRVDPTKILVEPGLLPHDYESSPNIIEEMDVPLGHLVASERFKHKRGELKALARDQKTMMFEDTFGNDAYNADTGGRELSEGMDEARKLRNMTTCYEIHDRMSGTRKFFVRASDGDRKGLLLENIDHPFLEAEAVKDKNPLPGEELDIEYTRPEGAKFIIEGGIPYFTEAFDLSDQFYGEPLASYEEQVEKVVMESQSRRADNLQRLKRIMVGDIAVKEENPQLPAQLKQATDGSMLWASTGANRSIRDTIVPIDWGSPQPDQLLLERDAKFDEQHLINVDATGGGSATEAAIAAGPAELNRAAMQMVPIGAYSWGIGAMLDIMADDRYANEEWFQSLARKGNVSPDQAIQQEWLRVKRSIDIHSASMTPFAAERERDAVLAFGDRYVSHPLVDPRKIIIQTAKAMNLPDPEGVLRRGNNIDAVRSAQFELVNYAFNLSGTGQPKPMPNPVRGEDHQTHLEIQDPEKVQGMPEFRNLNPAVQPAVLQVVQQHIAMHQGMIDQEAEGTGGPVATSKPDEENPSQGLISQTRSNAQELQQTVATQSNDRGVV